MVIVIDILGVICMFGLVVGFDGIDLFIVVGEFFMFFGLLGCGKSMFLKFIGGFDWFIFGDIVFDGRSVFDIFVNCCLVNIVFQNFVLFLYMIVVENIGYGLKFWGLKGVVF